MYLDMDLLTRLCDDMGLTLTEKQKSDFETFAGMVVEKNKVMNLTAVTSPDGMAVKHFADSLSLLTCGEWKENISFLDVGTGAGFPSIPLLIMRRDIKGVLLDAQQKRLNFLNDVIRELNLNAITLHARAEEAAKDKKYRENFDIVTARAVAAMPPLSEYCLPFVKVGGKFLAMKGPAAAEEADNAKNAVKILGGKVEEIKEFKLDEETRNIIVVSKTGKTPPQYPRLQAKISKSPL